MLTIMLSQHLMARTKNVDEIVGPPSCRQGPWEPNIQIGSKKWTNIAIIWLCNKDHLHLILNKKRKKSRMIWTVYFVGLSKGSRHFFAIQKHVAFLSLSLSLQIAHMYFLSKRLIQTVSSCPTTLNLQLHIE